LLTVGAAGAAGALTTTTTRQPVRYAPTTSARYAPATTTPAAPATIPVPPAGTAWLPPPSGPKAWVLVDADTGNVIKAVDDHVVMRPASIAKVLTAIIATQDLPADAVVPVTPVSQGAESVDLGMKAGEVWTFNDTLHAMLMLSANDAATALAERISGRREDFISEMERAAKALRLVDRPILRDATGLDDQFSVAGGDFISAYDLAIIARTALAIPAIREIVGLHQYRFTAPDGVVHVIDNVDRGIQTYLGAIGIKTGYTKAAGNTYMAAANRDGRTMIAIVLQSPDIYRSASDLLDLGFSTPVAQESSFDQLPSVSLAALAPPVTPTPVSRVPTHVAAATPTRQSGLFAGSLPYIIAAAGAAVLVLGLIFMALRRRAVRRRRHALFEPLARHY
jgi:D-alanyl-D-alanine carboxypeptidase (penicillin-binding protein 5/6)